MSEKAVIERGKLIVTDEVAAILGQTKDQIAAMTLGQFIDRASKCGRNVKVSGFNLCGDGRLLVTCEDI